MAVTLTIIDKRRDVGNKIAKVFQVLFSGSYTNSGAIGSVGVPGETLAFNSALNPNKIARPKLPSVLNGSTSNLLPTSSFTIEGLPAGYTGRVEKNATSPTANNYVLRLFTAAGTELGSGNYPAALSGDTTGAIIVAQVPMKQN